MIKRQSCPVCNGELPEATPGTFPFCSERCQKVDFFRWCDGRYAIVEQLDPVEAQLMAMEGEVPLQDSSDKDG